MLEIPSGWCLEKEDLVAGVDIGGTQCSVNLAHFSTSGLELLVRQQFATDVQRGPDAIVSDIERRLRDLLSDSPTPVMVGVSCGGPLDPDLGVIKSPPNLPGWDDIPLAERLQSSLGIPCVVENDANAGAVAEWSVDAGRRVDNLVFLTFGTGLGAGMIVGGEIYRGAGGLAGEVGHWRLGGETGPSNYGKQGSFQGFCSGTGIVEWYRHWRGAAPDRSVSAEMLADRARTGDLVAKRVFDQAAHQLGRGIAMLIDAFAFEVVVIGGIFVYANDLLQAGMEDVLAAEAHPKLLENCTVRQARLAALLGSYASCFVGLQRFAASRGNNRWSGMCDVAD